MNQHSISTIMTSSRTMTIVESQGQATGTAFDDSSIIRDISGAALTRIIVYHQGYINSLAVKYTGSEEAVTHGGTGGSRSEIHLESGELITMIEARVNHPLITQLKFVTNTGVTFGPYGSATGSSTRFVWKAADGIPADLAPRMGLLYFSGSACQNHVRQIRATFALYPEQEKKLSHNVKALSSNLKFEEHVPTQLTSGVVAHSSFARNIMSPVVVIHVGPDAVIFHAYEAILCRISFFKAALQGRFLEATEKKIMIPEETSEIFSALIEHLYTGSYTYTHKPNPDTNDTPAPDLAQGCFHARVYAVASRYDWKPLVDDSVRNFLFVLPMLSGMDIVRLWKAGYEYELTVAICAGKGLLVEFQKLLPSLLQGLYETDGEEMDGIVSEFPALASDFMRLLVAANKD